MTGRPWLIGSEPETSANRIDCPFCREIAAGNVVAALGAVVALRDAFPVADGHLLIVPRRHVHSLFELSAEETADTWRLLTELHDELVEADADIAGFNVGANIGTAAGQTIPHVHVHLIPRRSGDTPRPRGGVRGVIPDRMTY